MLIGRHKECAAIDQLIEVVRAGGSGALVIHGAAGVGKTALLNYIAGHSKGCQIARTGGVQSEMELPFAGLHQLCGPHVSRIDRLPTPQRQALAIVFGVADGAPPDMFMIGLSVLGLLSEVARDKPLLCLVDDQQWLDHASIQVLAFVARRLGAESVGLVFGTRVPGRELARLPTLKIAELSQADSRKLLDSVLTASLDQRVWDQIIAETRGNPLAMLELVRGNTPAELAGGFAIPGGTALWGDVEEGFRYRIGLLPAQSRRLIRIAAADPTGDPALVRRAAHRLGIEADAEAPIVDAGLAEFGTRVRFRHPLARSVSYWTARLSDRQRVHGALAAETDRQRDPDRYSWHLAQAAAGPDEAVAAELERSAGRARGRGGLAAAAAFLERAAILTLDPVRRAERAVTAAMAKLQAGELNAAGELLELAESGPLTDLQAATVALARAQLAFVLSRGGEAPLLLLRAAERFRTIDPGTARDTYLDALAASTFAGRAASRGGAVLDVARAAASMPVPANPEPTDFLLAGLAANFTDGYAAGVGNLQQALVAFDGVRSGGMPADRELRSMWLMTLTALHLWDDDQWSMLSARYVELARTSGALSELPLALSTRAMMLSFTGDLDGLAVLAEEQAAVTEATASQLSPYSGMCLAAVRGRRDESYSLIGSTAERGPSKGEGISVAVAEWTRAILHNGLGEYAQAMAAAQRALDLQEYPDRHYPGIANWAAAELVEAAARRGETEVAIEAADWITEMTAASGTNWARGVGARSKGLVAQGAEAETQFREALASLQQTSVDAELARTRLLYGEWLRRERRRTDARSQLRMAYRMFEEMGMEAFAERARRELQATGETARKRTVSTENTLTAQEAMIARLARDGLSNPDIASRLFISARTVQYHLHKVFSKLAINSRSQLDRVPL